MKLSILKRYKYAQENYGDDYFKIPEGKWSEKKIILAVRDNKNGTFDINLSRGDYPNVTEEDIKIHFKFYED